MKKLLGLLLIVLVCVAGYLLFWPVPIEPVAWHAPEAPGLSGKYAANDRLADIERIPTGSAVGPETVIVDDRGRLYAGFADGTIRRFKPDGSDSKILADTGGRPAGLAWAPGGSIVIADVKKGLLVLRSDGSIRVLARSVNGDEFCCLNDVAVAADGTIYFTDSTRSFDFDALKTAMLVHDGRGRLLKYEPIADRVTVLLKGLQFANGVAIGPNEEYVLVNETGAYRITRYWLRGSKAGMSEVWVENLPGLPDGLSYNGDGIFWLALFAPRIPALDALSDNPFLRKMVYRLPDALKPAPEARAFVLGLAPDGSVVYNLQYAGEHVYAPIATVQQAGDTLYLGSVGKTAIGRIPVPQ